MLTFSYKNIYFFIEKTKKTDYDNLNENFRNVRYEQRN